ncbi:MAG: hypothetical protein WGN25_05560 [Candidatus Electrothrix sp. GW3-4]|uniref:hypothetical protein n=1 Tax=Candidatus Electrothrix sp. GW3-4 TaxID=3126740 RepID=UPI0030D02FF8
MEKLMKFISDFAPFIASYPGFVKVLFILWVFISAALFVSLILARSSNPPAKEVATGNSKRSAASARDVWMIIEGLEFFAARPGAQVRVTANVNGTNFLYPSVGGIEWLEVGPSMSSQVYHLPPTRERYLVRFEAEVRIPARAGKEEILGKLTSVKEDIIAAQGDIPFSGKYILHTFDPVHMARGAEARAMLLYRLTYDPK